MTGKSKATAIPIGVSGPSLRRRTISECWLSMRNRGGRLFRVSRQLTLLEIHIRLKIMTKISLHADSDLFNTLPRSHFNRTFLYALVDCVRLLTVSIGFIIAGCLTVTVFLLLSLYLCFFVMLGFVVLRKWVFRVIELLVRYIFSLFIIFHSLDVWKSLQRKQEAATLHNCRKKSVLFSVFSVFWFTHRFDTLHGSFHSVIELCNINFFKPKLDSSVFNHNRKQAGCDFTTRTATNVKLCNRAY